MRQENITGGAVGGRLQLWPCRQILGLEYSAAIAVPIEDSDGADKPWVPRSETVVRRQLEQLFLDLCLLIFGNGLVEVRITICQKAAKGYEGVLGFRR